MDGGWLPREVPQPPSVVAGRGHSVPPLPWGPVASIGFAKMVGFLVVVGCSSLTVAGVGSLGCWRQNERQGSRRWIIRKVSLDRFISTEFEHVGHPRNLG